MPHADKVNMLLERASPMPFDTYVSVVKPEACILKIEGSPSHILKLAGLLKAEGFGSIRMGECLAVFAGEDINLTEVPQFKPSLFRYAFWMRKPQENELSEYERENNLVVRVFEALDLTYAGPGALVFRKTGGLGVKFVVRGR